MAELTTTSYAILGLLGLRPSTSYELAKQVQRSLRYYWPRAERKLYDEPKRLVEAGLATARRELVGRRGRTVYTITPAGRRALARWLGEPPKVPFTIEFEGMVKVFLAEQGSTEGLQRVLDHIRAEAMRERLVLADLAASNVRGDSAYPQRVHVNALAMRFEADFLDMVDAWAAWASDSVAQWPDVTGGAESWREQAFAVFEDVSRIQSPAKTSVSTPPPAQTGHARTKRS